MLSSFILFILAGLGSAFGPQESFGFEISFGIYAFSRFVIACANRGINDTGYILGKIYRLMNLQVFLFKIDHFQVNPYIKNVKCMKNI